MYLKHHSISMGLRSRYGAIIPASSVEALLALPPSARGAQFMFPALDAEEQTVKAQWLVAADILRGVLPLPEIGEGARSGIDNCSTILLRWLMARPRDSLSSELLETIRLHFVFQGVVQPPSPPSVTHEEHPMETDHKPREHHEPKSANMTTKNTFAQAVAETDDDVMTRGYVTAQNRLKLLEANNAALQAQTQQQEQQLAEKSAWVDTMMPFALHGIAVVNTTNLVTTTLIAKQLNTTAIRLNRFLHERGVIFKHDDCWHLNAQYADHDLARVITWRRVGADGALIARDMLKWTGKGRMFISNLWHEVHYLP